MHEPERQTPSVSEKQSWLKPSVTGARNGHQPPSLAVAETHSPEWHVPLTEETQGFVERLGVHAPPSLVAVETQIPIWLQERAAHCVFGHPPPGDVTVQAPW